MLQRELSGAWGKMIHEKIWSKNSWKQWLPIWTGQINFILEDIKAVMEIEQVMPSYNGWCMNEIVGWDVAYG